MGQDPTEPPLVQSGLRARIRLTYRAVRANPLGDLAIKIFIAALGGLVVVTGIVLIPLPGPGWLIVILGLTIWAIEFVWARHLLRYTKQRLHSWTSWIGRQSWPVRLIIGLVGLLFVSAIAVTTLKYSFGVDLVTTSWRYITTH